MSRPSKTPGISRIDQAAKHNHGFFARLRRDGKIYSAFFADKAHGGRKKALAAATAYHQNMLKIFGPPMQKQRRWWAEIRRRKGSSSVVGVHKSVVRRGGRVREYWTATWSPKPYGAVRKLFSINRYGFRKARQMAIRARRAGLRNLE